MRMLTIVAIASLIALSGLASAQAQTTPIRARLDLPSPMQLLTKFRSSMVFPAARCMIGSSKRAFPLHVPATFLSVGSR